MTCSAKKLLADAGYGDGFEMTIHGPNDRYINDAKIAEALAQMFSRIGIKAKVETMPKAVYFKEHQEVVQIRALNLALWSLVGVLVQEKHHLLKSFITYL